MSYPQEEICRDDHSVVDKEFEDVENNQNVLNKNVIQSKDEKLNMETLSQVTYNIVEKDVLSHDESNEEVEDEITFFCDKRSRKNKLMAILDSDSEHEEKDVHSAYQNNNNASEKIEIIKLENEDNVSTVHSKKTRRIAIIDSDSDEESSSIILETFSKSEQEGADISQFGADKSFLPVDEKEYENQTTIISNLCDSESSDDNSIENHSEHLNNDQISDNELDALQANKISTSKSRKSKPKNTNNEKMTAKKALEQKKEIFSESQRRIRESRISLPYHKPKSRTLKEFLENRPKLASALKNVEQTSFPSAAIKMSMEQLAIVSQNLKEREKEMKQFYKSESESENEDPPQVAAYEESDALTQETETSDGISADNSSQQAETEENKKNSVVETEGQCNSKSGDFCEEMDITENRKQLDMKNSVDTTSKSPGIQEVTSTATREIITEISSFNPKERNQTNEKNFEGDAIQDEQIEERERECMDTLKSPNTFTDILGEQGDRRHNVSDVQKIPQKETECINQTRENLECVDNEAEIEKSEKTLHNSLFESGENKNLIILSDVILKAGNSDKSVNFYSLDNELSDLTMDANNSKGATDKYDFNLDGLEDDFENFNEVKTKIVENENVRQMKKNRRLELLEKLGSLKPRLSGGPNEVIDLENGLTIPDEVSKLRERFMQHNIKMGKQKHKKEISILSVTDGEIRKETLAMNVDEDDEESIAPIEKPGVRLQKLREELEHQMAQRRSDLWKEKFIQTKQSKQENEGETVDEESDCGIDHILDNDEEEEFTEDEYEDEEMEENDCDMSEKKKMKSTFIEEEAEESELEEEGFEETQLNQSRDEEDEMEEQNFGEENADAEDNDEMEELEDAVPKKRVLKRIITTFNNEDSDDASDEECLPPHQPINYKIREPVLTPTKSETDFLTPVTYMTGLQNLNTSGSRILATTKTSPDEKVPHKQLFSDETGLKSQVSDGDFPNTQELIDTVNNHASSLNEISKSTEHNVISTQDVLEICSGNFPTSRKSISSPEVSTQQFEDIFIGTKIESQESDFNSQDLADICSGQFTGTTPIEKKKYEEIVLDEGEENIISQLIDEEELERFKKKFESPVATYTQETRGFECAEEVQGTGGVIDSEDDDEELHLKKKNSKRLAFSDEDNEEALTNENSVDIHDEDQTNYVEYDSEENEIDAERRESCIDSIKRVKLKASDFFENEAELSESEWDSEDEDEQNLDDMEFEKGDEENFDDDKLRSDIERVQMRQMLDDDNREVKLLQELLLEDGELHGSGRQRQFRWKNIDAAGNATEETKFDDGDVYLDDDESEEHWRKMRHEREMFMQKKQSQQGEENVLIESQGLSFNHKTLKIKSQTSVLSHNASEEPTSSPKIKQPFSLLNKRGSFLSRSEQILQKFVETTKVYVGTKSTSRIVFQAVDGEMKKRKASQTTDSTPVALKKLRLSNLSPAVQNLKPKVGKSLFGNLSTD